MHRSSGGVDRCLLLHMRWHTKSTQAILSCITAACAGRLRRQVWCSDRLSHAPCSGGLVVHLPARRISNPIGGRGSECLLGSIGRSTPQLAELSSSREAMRILAVRKALTSELGGVTLYYPWIPYGHEPVRMFQSYLVKLPMAAIALFPRLAELLDQERAAWQANSGRTISELDEATEAVEIAAGQSAMSMTRRSLAQGFARDQLAKAAVEARAMNAAIEYFGADWTVEDVHGNESYDLKCRRGSEELHVEVKGTTSAGEVVLLTRNEVEHAKAFAHVALFVLAGIVVVRSVDGQAIGADGGMPMLYDPWALDESRLQAVGYQYRVPK